MTVRVIHGDMLEAIPALVADGIVVDAIVTDPPYGLEFMGASWDSFKTGRAAKYASGGDIDLGMIASRSGKGGAGPNFIKRPAKRCGKCGRQAWSGTPCRCEEPQWISDNSPLYAFQEWSRSWANACYSILRPGGYLLAFGGTRTAHRMVCAIEDAGFVIQDTIAWLYGSGFPKNKALLKPAFEPIVVAYKPGGPRTLQVEECRVGTEVLSYRGGGPTNLYNHGKGRVGSSRHLEFVVNGRWPANVCLSPDGGEYELRSGVTAEQRSELFRWLSENP